MPWLRRWSHTYKQILQWMPGKNTIAYRPLNSTTTTNDMKPGGTKYNLTAYNMTYDSVSAIFPSNNTWSTRFYQWSMPGLSAWDDFYMSVWMRHTGTNNARAIAINGNRWYWILNNNSTMNFDENEYYWASISMSTHTSLVWKRVYIFYTWKKGWATRWWYIYEWVEYSVTGTWHDLPNWIILGTNGNSYYMENDSLKWNLSEVIIENKQWTADERMRYYNYTKDLYS